MSRTALYRGRVAHARVAPTAHAFSYATYMLALDLDDLESQRWLPIFGIERAALLSFRRIDYRGDPSRPLKATIQDDVERELGFRPDGPIVLLAHVRALGFVFNPVSFYYCHDASGSLVAIVAEITNTPWRGRHAYVLPARNGRVEMSFDKRFHVSPFMRMEQRYAWSFSPLDDEVTITMSNQDAGARIFSAKLVLRRAPMTRLGLLRTALAVPFVGLKVLGGIYWNAFLLFVKGTPRFAHPREESS